MQGAISTSNCSCNDDGSVSLEMFLKEVASPLPLNTGAACELINPIFPQSGHSTACLYSSARRVVVRAEECRYKIVVWSARATLHHASQLLDEPGPPAMHACRPVCRSVLECGCDCHTVELHRDFATHSLLPYIGSGLRIPAWTSSSRRLCT